MKIQYEIVALEVEKMFADTISLNDESEINSKFLKIFDFIRSCGWDPDEYNNYQLVKSN